MEPHQERVIAEKAARDLEIKALQKFIRQSPIFDTLDLEQQWLLTTQCHVMVQLSSILGQRIAAFNKEKYMIKNISTERLYEILKFAGDQLDNKDTVEIDTSELVEITNLLILSRINKEKQ
jgi:hypothetical protein